MKKSTVNLKKVLILNSINNVFSDEAYNINIAWNVACN